MSCLEGTLGSIIRALLMYLWQEILCNSSICSEVELCQRRASVSDGQGLLDTYGIRMASQARV